MPDPVSPPVTVADTLHELRIVDAITLAPGTAAAFLERMERVYLPEVAARGYELTSCSVSPPLDVDGEPVHVVLQWSLSGLASARAAAPRWDLRLLRDASAAAASFWDDERAAVIDRQRHVMRDVVRPLQPSWPAPAAGTTATAGTSFPSPAPAVRCVVFVHTADRDPSLEGVIVDALNAALGADPLYSH